MEGLWGRNYSKICITWLRKPFWAFANLKQLSTVRTYLTNLNNCKAFSLIFTQTNIFEKFMDDLKEDIRIDVEASKLTNFKEAAALAKIYEKRRFNPKKSFKSNFSSQPSHSKNFPSKNPKSGYSGPLSNKNNTLTDFARSNGLTLEEILEKGGRIYVMVVMKNDI